MTGGTDATTVSMAVVTLDFIHSFPYFFKLIIINQSRAIREDARQNQWRGGVCRLALNGETIKTRYSGWLYSLEARIFTRQMHLYSYVIASCKPCGVCHLESWCIYSRSFSISHTVYVTLKVGAYTAGCLRKRGVCHLENL